MRYSPGIMFLGMNSLKSQKYFAEHMRAAIDKYTVTTMFAGKEKKRIPGGDLIGAIHGLFLTIFSSFGHPVPLFLSDWTHATDNGTCACFNLNSWTVSINPKLAPMDADWSRRQAAIFCKSVFHEMRHAEQHCLMIRYARSQNAKLSAGDLRKNILTTPLGVCPPLEVITALDKTTFLLGKDVQKEDFDLAVKFYHSVFRTRTVIRLEPTVLTPDYIEPLVVDETVAANVNMRNAETYADMVDKELKQWNAAKPASFFPSGAVEVSLKEGKDLWAIRDEKPLSGKYHSLAYRYMQARREAALQWRDEAYAEYVGVPIEADAHASEKGLAKELKLSEKGADKGLSALGIMKKPDYLPEPMLW
jgi:hypothetical protein